jgi:hypothetical protein
MVTKKVEFVINPENYEEVLKALMGEYGKLLVKAGEFDSVKEATASVSESCMETLEELLYDEDEDEEEED